MSKKKSPWTDGSLSELLAQVDTLFTTKRKRHSGIIDYSLNKFPGGWRFDVMNDWQKWHSKGLRSQTDLYERPEVAVMAFLEYVHSSGISVRRLMSHEQTRY